MYYRNALVIIVLGVIIGNDKGVVHSQATSKTHGVSLSLRPGLGKFEPGQDVMFTCTHDMGLTGLGADSLGWSRRTGNLTLIISKAMLMTETFLGQQRYRITRSIDSQKKIVTYTLSITGLKLEDSGTINCYSWMSNRGASKSLAVCVDPTSSTCDCVLREGWATPVCYGGSKTAAQLQASCDKTITGIGVCFAIAIIYGVIITVLFAKDCLRILRQKRKRKEMRRKMMEQRGGVKGQDPYADSEKLTLDANEETASVPDSGVFEGGNNNNSGRRQLQQSLQQKAAYNENMARNRPVVRTQAHVNAAYNADEITDDPHTIEEKAEVYNKPPVRPPPPNLDVSMRSDLRRSRENLAPDDGLRASPRSDYHEKSYNSPDYSQPSAKPRLPSVPAPSSTQSEGRGARPRVPNAEYTMDNQRTAYTDVNKYDSTNYPQQRSHYTEPRRLDFVPQESSGHHGNDQRYYGNNQPQRDYPPSGPYIDDHDTEI